MKKDILLTYNNDIDQRTYKGFNSDNRTIVISGVQTLLQRITKILLTQVGSDYYNGALGTDIPSLMSKSGNTDRKKIEDDILLIIGNVEEQIKTEQVSDFSLDGSETLVSINLEDITFSNNGDEIYITLYIKTADKNEYLIRI